MKNNYNINFLKTCIFLFTLCIFNNLKAQIDTIPPNIVYKNGNINCVQLNSIWVLGKFIITDNITADSNIIVEKNWVGTNGPLNTSSRANYTLEVKATDEAGNITYKNITFRVDDCIPPVINLNTKDTICHKAGTPYNSIAATITDNYYDKSQLSLIKIGGFLNPNVKGLYFEVFEATDGSGNKTTKTRYVLVSENCNTLSILNNNTVNISIYPNPVNNFFNVDNIAANSYLKLVTIDGKLVSEFIATDNSKVFATNNLTNGIYFLNIIQNNTLKVFKIVINH